MSEHRLRLQHFVLQPVVVWDDGTDLAPGPVVQPQPLTLAGLRDLLDHWPEKLEELREKAVAEALDKPGEG